MVSRWAILAAGISEETAESHFKRGSQRASDATIPLQVAGGGRAEILLQMRPVEWPNSHPKAASFLATIRRDEDSLGRDREGPHQPGFRLPTAGSAYST